MSPAIKVIAAIAVAFAASSAVPAFAKTTTHQGGHTLAQVSTAYAFADRGGAYADTLSPADRQGFYYRQ
jgi:hypothetical protein